MDSNDPLSEPPAPTESARTGAPVLPAPTGEHAVGRSSFDWLDETRTELYGQDPHERRRLVVWLWYPAVASPGAQRAEYLPTAWSATAQYLGLDVDGCRANSVAEAPVLDGTARFPVLVLSPSGFPPLFLAALAEELASHGYVVVGVNHTYETTVTAFNDGRTVAFDPAAIGGALGPQSGSHNEAFRARAEVCKRKAADLAFVGVQLARLDADPASPFVGRLDLGRVGALGHSFGGVAALEWCRADPRCRAAVNLDGAVWSDVGTVGLDRPALQILAEHPEFSMKPTDAVTAGMAPDVKWFEAERAIAFDGWRRVHELASPGHTVRIAGATHLSFMDVPFLPQVDGAVVASMLAATTIDPARMWRLTGDLVLAFFARYLDQRPATVLDGPDPSRPELSYGPA